jgi:4-hydroxybenzoate polyprenyltransferase
MKKLIAFLKLIRLPNVFTAMADIACGLFISGGIYLNIFKILPLFGASSLIYSAGMITNDIADIKEDKEKNPNRPLPSGLINKKSAYIAAGIFLLTGISLAYLSGSTSFIISLLLTANVLLYNFFLKKTSIGPMSIALCRGLNIFLGVSLSQNTLNFFYLYVTLILVLYITGISIIAQKEKRKVISRLTLIRGLIYIESAFFLMVYGGVINLYKGIAFWILSIGLVIIINVLCGKVIFKPDFRNINLLIKNGLLCIILLDTILALGYTGNYYCLLILILFIPAKVLGKWFYVT